MEDKKVKGRLQAPSERIKNSDITENRFSIEFNRLANTVPVSIDINDDYNDEIINACTTVLETYGFKISQDSDNILKVMIEKFFRNVTNPDAVYCEATLSIYLNTDEGRVLFPFNYSGRAAGRENDIAQKKEYSILNNIIQNDEVIDCGNNPSIGHLYLTKGPDGLFGTADDTYYVVAFTNEVFEDIVSFDGRFFK